MTTNSFGTRDRLTVGDTTYGIHRLDRIDGSSRLPYSLKVLLENLARHEDGLRVTADLVSALASWDPAAEHGSEIAYTPARVLLQDFTGVPCVVDLVAMRDAMAAFGGDPAKINPLIPGELVIDHSVIADVFARPDAFRVNADLEFERNQERYQLLRWAQQAFDDFLVVPPDTGICHQVNLEYLSRVVFTRAGPDGLQAYPDTLVGTDSHTPMVNGLGVLGWGVGGIEAEAAMLGQPMSMLIPQVLGIKLTGEFREGTTATDLVFTIAELLRRTGVVGKFVEFYGPAVARIPLANRATLGNMSPEYGSTCAIFPVDDETLTYLRLTGRSEQQIRLVEVYSKEQGLWHDPDHEPAYSQSIEFDLASVEPSIAGPKRPQDRIPLASAARAIGCLLADGAPEPAQLTGLDQASAESFPRQRPDLGQPGPPQWAAQWTLRVRRLAAVALEPGAGDLRRREGRDHRQRARRDRGDHLVYEHLQPVGDGRRGAAGEEGRGGRAEQQTVGEDLVGARLAGGHRLLRPGRAHAVPEHARFRPGRLRLHDVHR